MRCRRALLVAVVALAGCATSGPMGSEILARNAKPGMARLVIYRSSVTGFAIQPDYAIDGQKVGSSQPNGFIVCDLRPGQHTVSVGNFPLSISIGPGADSFTTKLRPGSTTYLSAVPRMGIMTPGTIGLSEVPESQGRSDTATLYKTDSSC